MSTINKNDLSQYLHFKHGLSLKDSEDAVNALFCLMCAELEKGGEISLTGFGRLYVKHEKIVNIAGKSITKKAHIKFKQSVKLII